MSERQKDKERQRARKIKKEKARAIEREGEREREVEREEEMELGRVSDRERGKYREREREREGGRERYRAAEMALRAALLRARHPPERPLKVCGRRTLLRSSYDTTICDTQEQKLELCEMKIRRCVGERSFQQKPPLPAPPTPPAGTAVQSPREKTPSMTRSAVERMRHL